MPDYRTTKYGKRIVSHPYVYLATFIWQTLLWYIGIPWHNTFSDECTPDFNCCTKNDSFNHTAGGALNMGCHNTSAMKLPRGL
jgi:hypothetical protein